MSDDLSFDADVDKFIELLHEKLDRALDLQTLCSCGHLVTIECIRLEYCVECLTSIKITIGEQNNG